jgi:uncharacterized protein YndB with AHSA1/START domain
MAARAESRPLPARRPLPTPLSAPSADLSLEITRVFDAPRTQVFAAWTRREHLMHWCAPDGFEITLCEGDPRIGGAWRSSMRSPDGMDHRVRGVYREIVPNRRLVFTHAWDGEDGRPGHETVVTVTFEDERGKTRMTFRQTGFKSAASRDGHRGGWSESFERLAEALADRTVA